MNFFGFFRKKEDIETKKTGAADNNEIFNILKRLDIDNALIAHENWKIRLATFLEGKSTEKMLPEVICFDDKCDLGRWLHGEAKKYFGKHPSFLYLVSEHKNFHYHASNIVSLKMQGKDQKAEQLLKNEFNKTSERVNLLLKQLKDER